VRVFLETERLSLRRFTEGDVGLLVELDSDPEVMHFVTGGRPTSRREIETELLPACLGYYERYAGYGFWAAIERSTGRASSSWASSAYMRRRWRSTSPRVA
jgi:RimJ/RimL family protein N-acetyltransferase